MQFEKPHKWKYWTTSNIFIGPLFISMVVTEGKFLPQLQITLRGYWRFGNTNVK